MSVIHKRLKCEIDKLQQLSGSFILDSASPDAVIGRILPQSSIFNQAGFQIELKLPPIYPFACPHIHFITRIYHPNVDSGNIYFGGIMYSSDDYKTTTSLVEIVNQIINVIDNPDIDHAVEPSI